MESPPPLPVTELLPVPLVMVSAALPPTSVSLPLLPWIVTANASDEALICRLVTPVVFPVASLA